MHWEAQRSLDEGVNIESVWIICWSISKCTYPVKSDPDHTNLFLLSNRLFFEVPSIKCVVPDIEEKAVGIQLEESIVGSYFSPGNKRSNKDSENIRWFCVTVFHFLLKKDKLQIFLRLVFFTQIVLSLESKSPTFWMYVLDVKLISILMVGT